MSILTTKIQSLSWPARLLLAAAILALIVIGARIFAHQRIEGALLRADPDKIIADSSLRAAALRIGAPLFQRHCASCHGSDGRPDRASGVPDLRDQDLLYGQGSVSDAERIILHGIRAPDKRGWSLASMPAYASAKPYGAEAIEPFTPRDAEDVTQFLLSMRNRSTDMESTRRGADIFTTRGACWDCHQRGGEGDAAVGAPDLTDDIWLYGNGGHDAIYASITRGRAGVSPAFAKILTPVEARSLAVFVTMLRAPRAEGGK